MAWPAPSPGRIWDRRWMRTVTFVVVIAIHAVVFFLFAERWSPAGHVSEPQAPTILVFLPTPVSTRPVEPVVPSPLTPRAARPAAPKAPAPVRPEPKQQIPSSTPTPAPDWRAEAGIAANDVLEAEQRNRDRPSPLAPHDFSRCARSARCLREVTCSNT